MCTHTHRYSSPAFTRTYVHMWDMAHAYMYSHMRIQTDTLYPQPHIHMYIHVEGDEHHSRLLTIIGLFCKRALWKRLYSAKETCNSKEPTNHSHPIPITVCKYIYSLLHLECHVISISNLNLLGLFSTERGKRDPENETIDWDLRMKKWHCKYDRLYSYIYAYM